MHQQIELQLDIHEYIHMFSFIYLSKYFKYRLHTRKNYSLECLSHLKYVHSLFNRKDFSSV
jgi:hypothetical protein